LIFCASSAVRIDPQAGTEYATWFKITPWKTVCKCTSGIKNVIFTMSHIVI